MAQNRFFYNWLANTKRANRDPTQVQLLIPYNADPQRRANFCQVPPSPPPLCDCSAAQS